MLDPKNYTRLDFNIGLKSIGLTRLLGHIFDDIPEIPPQQRYRQKLRDTLRMILINLVDMELSHYDLLSYGREHGAKRKGAFSPRRIPKVVDAMSDMGLIIKYGYFYNEQKKIGSMPSRIRSSPKLITLFRKYDVNRAGIYKKQGKLIILRDENDKTNLAFKRADVPAGVEENIKKINSLLGSHVITLKDKTYSLADKRLHRVFNGDFRHGGRFYGGRGNWMYEKGKSKTRSLIRIGGKRTVELDFSAYHLAMLYSLRKIPIDTEKDLYSVGGYKPKKYREFFKSAYMRILNNKSKPLAIRSIRDGVSKGEIPKPPGRDIRILVDAFVNSHEPIKDDFFSCMGAMLQNHDSEIAEYVLMLFQRKGIPVLPVHDSFIVTTEHEQKLSETMKRGYRLKFDSDIKVGKK